MFLLVFSLNVVTIVTEMIEIIAVFFLNLRDGRPQAWEKPHSNLEAHSQRYGKRDHSLVLHCEEKGTSVHMQRHFHIGRDILCSRIDHLHSEPLLEL